MSADSNLRTITQQIFYRTLAAIEVEPVVRANINLHGDQLEICREKVDLARFKRLVVIAIGKASVAMARATEKILGERINDGMVVTNALIGDPPKYLPVLTGGHPLPNSGSLDAAARALRLLHACDAPDTLILFLISGGGSAIFEQPIDPSLTLDDLQDINRILVGCGAVISEMNLVRRRLSAVKGGKLSAAAQHSSQITLYISDVNSDDLTTVASGPTLADGSTPGDLERIITRYDLLNRFPPKVAALIQSEKVWQAARPQHQDLTRKPLRSHHLLLDNRRAMAEAKRIAENEFGFKVEIADDLVEGDIEEMARTHLERVCALRGRHHPETVCLLSGGEAICPVRGDGQGGRNQEFVLRSALMLEEWSEKNLVVLSAGTDGIDGNSPADGAIADLTTLRRARELGISAESHLEKSDSYNFFNSLGEAIITGPTGNNVRDLRILTTF